ncbi:acyl-ACP desaturase [Kitasatospora sp. McL0602]|uniref:acyl-ACP desaturase n=1 Tax=Kitasatospora sp. McL0602 TaxID=3439530 RepID=UPI003F89C909
MAHVGSGAATTLPGVLGAVAYAAVQELATRVSHRNTGRLSGDPYCERLLGGAAPRCAPCWPATAPPATRTTSPRRPRTAPGSPAPSGRR